MVSVIAIGPKVPGFKTRRGDEVLKAIQIRTMPSLEGEVKPEAPWREILWNVKDYLRYE
jgi:hypothetical protein